MSDLEFHKLANIFPLIEGAEFEQLKSDIAANGLREPIVLLDGKILDGRNRYRAARSVGIEPAVIHYQARNPLSYVVSLNLHRRHLSESQRAMVADRIATMRQGERTDLSQTCEKLSKQQAASLLNVHPNSVTSAHKVNTKGAPELVQAVEHGSVSVSAAADVATLEPGEQQEIVARGPKEILQKSQQDTQGKEREKQSRSSN